MGLAVLCLPRPQMEYTAQPITARLGRLLASRLREPAPSPSILSRTSSMRGSAPAAGRSGFLDSVEAGGLAAMSRPITEGLGALSWGILEPSGSASRLRGPLSPGTGTTGIFRSTDGATWTQVNASVTNPVTALAVTSRRVFAGVYGNGVLRSSDDGATWTQFTGDLTDLRVEALAISSNGLIFAGTPSGVFVRSVQ